MDPSRNSDRVLGSAGPRERGRIAVVLPYWDFWETAVPWDFRADRESLLAEAVAIAGRFSSVEVAAVLPNEQAAIALRSEVRDLDAIVIVSTMAVPSATTMAVPSATTMALLAEAENVPVLVWALSQTPRLADGFSHTDITTAGSTVGTPMITSALARARRRFDVVATSTEEPEAAVTAIRRVMAAGRIARGPILVVGKPISGYSTVIPPADSDFPINYVALPVKEFAEAAHSSNDDQVRLRVAEIREQFDVQPTVTALAIRRAAQAEVALRQIVQQAGAVAGTINCHEESLRGNPEFGIAPCLALGRLTTEGVPFTCTGDVLTALAMLTVQSLGYPTLYHEREAIDFENDEVVLANSGEHDLGLCPNRADLFPNTWYAHDAIVGPCALDSIPAGPASLVAFVMAPQPRFVVAQGSFTGHEFPQTGVPNAGFRFNGRHVAQAWADWARSGVTHHSAATNVHLAEDIRAIANLLGAEFVQVS